MSDEFRNTDVSDLVLPDKELVAQDDDGLFDALPNVDNPIRLWFHNYTLLKFMKKMRHVPFEAIDRFIVEQTYPAAVWKMREFALTGQYTETRAMELWLKWAGGVLARPDPEPKNVTSKGSAAFAPREPAKEESE